MIDEDFDLDAAFQQDPILFEIAKS